MLYRIASDEPGENVKNIEDIKSFTFVLVIHSAADLNGETEICMMNKNMSFQLFKMFK